MASPWRARQALTTAAAMLDGKRLGRASCAATAIFAKSLGVTGVWFLRQRFTISGQLRITRSSLTLSGTSLVSAMKLMSVCMSAGHGNFHRWANVGEEKQAPPGLLRNFRGAYSWAGKYAHTQRKISGQKIFGKIPRKSKVKAKSKNNHSFERARRTRTHIADTLCAHKARLQACKGGSPIG